MKKAGQGDIIYIAVTAFPREGEKEEDNMKAEYKRLLTLCLTTVMLAGCGNVANVKDIQHKTTSTASSVAEDVTTDDETEVVETITTTTTEGTTTTLTEETTTQASTSKKQTTLEETKGDETQQSVEVVTTTKTTTTTTAAPVQTTTAVQTTTQAPQTTAPAETSQGEKTDGEYTSKGYKIEVKNGVTYVGGILIVNKSYSVPSSYGSALDSEALNAFYEMQSAASKDGIWLTIVSGYRSYWYQDQLYWGYVYNRGGVSEADRFSARAGHSEHQTGLSMDLNNASRSFVGTKEAAWIEAHCVDYGFIVRYPDGKEDVTGFMYEPWHVRYLGKELARSVADSGLTLEEYLGIDSYYH